MGSKAQIVVADLQKGQHRTRPRVDLPAQASSLVGRERELDDLEGVLASSRLLTLTGPGGSGKTRLALQIAARLAKTSRTASVMWSWPPSRAPSL